MTDRTSDSPAAISTGIRHKHNLSLSLSIKNTHTYSTYVHTSTFCSTILIKAQNTPNSEMKVCVESRAVEK